jgi:hypothetical protein
LQNREYAPTSALAGRLAASAAISSFLRQSGATAPHVVMAVENRSSVSENTATLTAVPLAAGYGARSCDKPTDDAATRIDPKKR